MARGRRAPSRGRENPPHPGRDRPGPPRLLYPAARGLGTEEGLAGGRPADRPRRRAFVQRAGNPRRAGSGDGPVCGQLSVIATPDLSRGKQSSAALFSRVV